MMFQQNKPECEPDSYPQQVSMQSGLCDSTVQEIKSQVINSVLQDYLKFILFSFLLVVPAYAIVKSFISQNWLMLVIDILLVPVGFVHGILLLAGIVE